MSLPTIHDHDGAFDTGGFERIQRLRRQGFWARGRLIALALLVMAPILARAESLTALAHPPSRPSAHPPLIVLLHGAGADERDMITMWPQLPPELVVLSPRAPFADSGGGYRWYRKASQAADIAVSRKIVDAIVESAVKRFDADPSRVFLAGFSQGAVLTYEVALAEPGRFRGAAALSGSLPAGEAATLKPDPARNRESFFIGHGTADRIIAFSAATSARTALARLGIPTAFHAYPEMRHETGAAEMKDFSAWLAARLAP